MSLEQDRPVEFSKPIRQIVFMVAFLALVGAAGYLLYRPIETVFFANPWLNGGIGLVFVVGVLLTFAQVFQLYGAVNWLEAFAIDRPGHEFVRPPILLASLSALLRDPRARKSLTAVSTRSILDTVATRLDETRDVTRYIVNLLIFLGLLGTFWGLANTVPAVVDTIRNLAPQEGEEGVGRLRPAAGRAGRSAGRHGHRLRLVAAGPGGISGGGASGVVRRATPRTASIASWRNGCPRSRGSSRAARERASAALICRR